MQKIRSWNISFLLMKQFLIAGPDDELPGLWLLWGGRRPPHHDLSDEDSVRQHLHPTNKWVLTSSSSSAQTNIHCIWHQFQWLQSLLLTSPSDWGHLTTPISSWPSWVKSKTNGSIQFLRPEILISDIIVSNYFHQPEVKFPVKTWWGGSVYNCKTGG